MTVGTSDFPVTWDDPADANHSWGFDKMHNPNAVAPLLGDLQRLVEGGLAHGFATYKIPARLASKYTNGYIFMALKPEPGTPEELEAKGQASQGAFMEAIGRLGELWETKWEPELRDTVTDLEKVEPGELDDAALLAHWVHTVERVERLWHVHFECLLPSYLAISELDELYGQAFPDADPQHSFRLIQGIDNLTVASGRGLWELAQRAKDSPEVLAALRSDDPMLTLASDASGREFVKHLRAYLDEFGHRGDLWSIEHPSWIEDPAPVFHAVLDYVQRDGEDPRARVKRLADERAALIADARSKLEGSEIAGAFEFLLSASETGVVISENHGYWVDFRGMHYLRRVALAVGDRLVSAGVLPERDDVMMLSADEITQTLAEAPELDRSPLVANRKADLERFRTLTPPPFIGAAPQEGPENPVARAMGKFFGGPATQSGADDVVSGLGVSPGVVRGTARLIESIDEADRLAPGEILVCATTSPPWTPLFGIASAVVTDTGGPISHTAVVAREYAIPAVVGTDIATTKVSDGQTIEVDGSTGTVRIIR